MTKIAHSERSHARLSPSGSKRWINCPGSPREEDAYPDQTSEHAADGTHAHELGETCLRNGRDAAEYVDRQLGDKTVNAEKADAVQMYLDHCRPLMADDMYSIEERVEIDAIGDSGTADFIGYIAKEKVLEIVDLKYGRGVAVDAIDNTQGLLYALGAIKRYHNYDIDKVRITIVQPRAQHADGPVRSWEIDYGVLVDWAIELMEAVEATKDPKAPLRAGTWCQFCKHAPNCEALRNKALDTAMADFTPAGDMIVADPAKLSLQKRSEVYKNIGVLELYCRRVREFEHGEAIHGRGLPEWKLVGNRATRKFKDAAAAHIEIKMAAIDADIPLEKLYETPELKSLAQLEKVFGKKNFEQFADLIEKKSSGTVLAPLDDPRPPVTPDAIAEFSAVEIED